MLRLVYRLLLVWVSVAAAPAGARAQTALLKGRVFDDLNQPIAGVQVAAEGTALSTLTDEKGLYSLTLPAGIRYRIRFTHPEYRASVIELTPANGRTYDEPVKLILRTTDEVQIIGDGGRTGIDDRSGMLISPIRMEDVIKMPTVSPSVEGFVRSMPGVASNNEFSSQYQVRGGNFDENLVYVNGIEIYRPFLARTGQQEGLGFGNPSMTEGIQFSTGGFSAVYGDKLSSVLDITYRRPTRFRATAEVGIITTSLHAEGVSRPKPDKTSRFTWLLGARRFDMSYLLNSLNTTGDYRPSFLDAQGLLTWTPSHRARPERIVTRRDGQQDTVYIPDEKLTFSAFFAASRNRYLLIPTGRETTFGSITQAFRLRVAFEGREISGYTTGLGALKMEYRPTTRWYLNTIVSAFYTLEEERFDVEGGYLLGEVNTSFGTSEFNETEFDLGIGTEFKHGRNFLLAQVASAETNFRWTSNNQATHRIQGGLRVQYQHVEDELQEYAVLDSAGYLVDSTGQFGLDEYIAGKARLDARLYKAYLSHEWQLTPAILFTWGGRVIWHDLIGQWMVSPRAQVLFRLRQDAAGQTDLRLRLAAGVYHQPPFYREFRRFDGSLNLDLQAQRSTHLIAGLDYRFTAWNRPFRLFSEAYYKFLYNLIPYEVSNIRIRYYPDRVADGYAYGLDLRVNGEVIKGVDSWVSLGLLRTSEDVRGDTIGYVPRPTDQRFTFAMYFQDELPINPTYKVHVNYVYGSGMRHGEPGRFDRRTLRQFPAYHRVDIGFSKLISFRTQGEIRGARGLESIWATVEIYNLLQRENTVSYNWIKDLQNNLYGVPNYLSARLLNVRLVMKFW